MTQHTTRPPHPPASPGNRVGAAKPELLRCGFCSSLLSENPGDNVFEQSPARMERLAAELPPARLAAALAAEDVAHDLADAAALLSSPDLPEDHAAELIDLVDRLARVARRHGPIFKATMMVCDLIEVAAVLVSAGEQREAVVTDSLAAFADEFPSYARKLDREAFEAAVTDWMSGEKSPGAAKWKTIAEVLERAGLRPFTVDSQETLRVQHSKWRKSHPALAQHMKALRSSRRPVT